MNLFKSRSIGVFKSNSNGNLNSLFKALYSGFNGYKAMIIQVTSLIWLRTIMNYQYKHGTSCLKTIKILYKQGGIKRFYSGFIPALIQAPIIRFGDTFSNTLVLNLMKNTTLPIYLKTACGSLIAGGVRIILMPIDTIKTISQIEGRSSFAILEEKVKTNGFFSLYRGAFANGLVTLIGHYPWFITHNYLNKILPTSDNRLKRLLRNGFTGFISSIVCDTSSNFLRVIKVYKQSNKKKISYFSIIKSIVRKDGLKGLFFRGLGVRLFTNGIQGLMFNVIWKYLDGKCDKKI